MKLIRLSFKLTLLLVLGHLLSGCLSEDIEVSADGESTAVTFSTYLRNNQSGAVTRAGALGETDTERLTAAEYPGFGVFADYTDKADFDYASAATGGKAFNFMWNQLVEWNAALPESSVTRWTYSPLKYWPNDNTPADDQDNNTSSDPATGSGATGSHSKVSFYAYAPWVSDGALSGTPALGLTAMTANSETAADTYLAYQLTSMKTSQSVDLLWSTQPNRYKTDGAGTTGGHVDFQFIHALSKLTVKVQGLFDHTTPDDTWPEYPTDVDSRTRILIESVEISNPKFYTQGHMHLVPRPNNATVPYWSGLDGLQELVLTGDINTSLKWTADPAHCTDAAEALAQLPLLPAGVTNTEVNLSTEPNGSYLLMPTATPQELSVRIVYHVITYDERLVLNTPRYFSTVTNTIDATAATSLQFEPNKAYTLRLLLGLTTVKFQVEVKDWAVPIMLDPVVHQPEVETHEYNVD